MIRLIVLSPLLMLLSCSVIRVSTMEDVKVYRKIGFFNVIDPPDTGAYVESSFVGIGFADDDLVLGYKKSKTVVLQDDFCTVFIDEKSAIEISVVSYLKSLNCNFIYAQGEPVNE